MAAESGLLPDQFDRALDVVDGLAAKLDTFLGSALHRIGRTPRAARRFRHFSRYYFELDYDWERIDYLCGVYRRAIPLVKRDLVQFRVFLEGLLR